MCKLCDDDDKYGHEPHISPSGLNAGLTLHDLSKAMFVAYNKHVKEHYYVPKMHVTFSPAGYDKAISCADAMMRFSHPCADKQTVNGYSFSIERDQKVDFVIHGDNVEIMG